MNCEETGLQKSISDSAEMRQVFCKTSSHIAPSHFFHPFLFIVLSLLLPIPWLHGCPPDHSPPF